MFADAKTLEKLKKAHEDSYQHDLQIVHALSKFEAIALDYYANGDSKQLTLGREDVCTGVTKRAEDLLFSLKNPFSEISNWIKGELLDIEGIRSAMAGRDMIMKRQAALIKRDAELKDDMAKLSSGKFSFKALFKNKNEIDAMVIGMEKESNLAQSDNESYDRLLHFLTILQG